MSKYLLLFISFFLIGLFTFGGGYAMIPMIQEVVLKHEWMSSLDEVFQFIGIAEATPGPFAVNIATFVGFNQGNIFGAASATLGVILPSFIIILIIASLGDKILKTKTMQNALKGIRPVVIGLIAVVAVQILFKNLFMTELKFKNLKIIEFDWVSLVITGLIITLSFVKIPFKQKKQKISPIVLIIIAGILGIFLYLI